jgi:hypothetical protein
LFNPSQEIADTIQQALKVDTVQEFYELMESIELKHSVKVLMNWLDTRVTHMVNMMTILWFGESLDFTCGSFHAHRTEYENHLYTSSTMKLNKEEAEAAYDDVEEMVIDYIRSLFSEIEVAELADEGSDITVEGKPYIETGIESWLLTIPWSVAYNSHAHTISVREFNRVQNRKCAQIFNILDQAYEMLDHVQFSILLVDITGHRYRVYKSGNGRYGRGQYFFESLGF